MDKWLSIAVIFATLAGPVLAVWITRRNDRANRQRERRTEILRLLMSARRSLMSSDTVRGLNMVEIDFHGEANVLRAYAELINHLNARVPDTDRYRNLLTRLLSEIAQTLGYKLQQLDVLEGGYYPQRFVDIENEQQEVRRALIEVLQGRRALTIGPTVATPPAPFPPPPAPPTGVIETSA